MSYGQLSPELATASKLMDLAIAHAARRLGALYAEGGEGGLVTQVLLRSPVRGLIVCVWGGGVCVGVCGCVGLLCVCLSVSLSLSLSLSVCVCLFLRDNCC